MWSGSQNTSSPSQFDEQVDSVLDRGVAPPYEDVVGRAAEHGQPQRRGGCRELVVFRLSGCGQEHEIRPRGQRHAFHQKLEHSPASQRREHLAREPGRSEPSGHHGRDAHGYASMSIAL